MYPGITTTGDLWKLEISEINSSIVTGYSGNSSFGEVLWVDIYLKNSTSPDFVYNTSNWHLVYNETNANLTHLYSMMSNRNLQLPIILGGSSLNQTINSTYRNLIFEFGTGVNNSYFNDTNSVTFWKGYANGTGSSPGAAEFQIDFNSTTFEIANVSLLLWGGASWALVGTFELLNKTIPTSPASPSSPLLFGQILFWSIITGIIIASVILAIFAIRVSRTQQINQGITIKQAKNNTTIIKIKKNN
jgi:hypothetical protein